MVRDYWSKDDPEERECERAAGKVCKVFQAGTYDACIENRVIRCKKGLGR